MQYKLRTPVTREDLAPLRTGDTVLAVADEVVLAQGAEGAVGDDEVQAGDQKEKRGQPQDHNVEFGGLEFFHPDSSLKDNSFL